MGALLILLLLTSPVLADIWQDCPTLVEFCKQRPFHRDCTPHTAWLYPKCTCTELRLADGTWPRRSCGWTDDPQEPDLTIVYDPPSPCLQPGYPACR